MPTVSNHVITEITEAFCKNGHRTLGDSISLDQHLRQTAHYAELDGASTLLVVAALLHDFGYMLIRTEPAPEDPTVDQHCRRLTELFLLRHFTPGIADIVRNMLPAKRYLATVDPVYYASLTASARRRLDLQGSFLTTEQVHAFEKTDHFKDAVRLRRYADLAKFPNLDLPALTHFTPYLIATLIR